jgi:hypothetical protein
MPAPGNQDAWNDAGCDVRAREGKARCSGTVSALQGSEEYPPGPASLVDGALFTTMGVMESGQSGFVATPLRADRLTTSFGQNA